MLRQSAYENLYGTLASFKTTTAAPPFYSQCPKKEEETVLARGRSTTRPLKRLWTRPTSLLPFAKNLIETVHQNMDKMHRYVRLRKKLLGVDELHFYDVHPPAERCGQAHSL